MATGLALTTLVLQSFVFAHHAAATAASHAETTLTLANLADLGLTLQDLPCHQDLLAASKDENGKPVRSSKAPCPACTLHSLGAVAVLPVLPQVPVPLAATPQFHVEPATLSGNDARHRPQQRGPPASA